MPAPDAPSSAQGSVPSTSDVDAGSAAAAHGSGEGGEVAPPVASEPVDAGGHITLVNVNDWYNPSWGGGYNATFQLTLTDDMLKGGSVEGWSLQVGLNNPNAAVSTGWLDGFNGTVSFDPSTGTFTNEGQDYKPELHAGDTIQFSVQVQNTGFNMADFSFSYTDLDPALQGTAGISAELGTPAQDAVASIDTGDAQVATMSADMLVGEQGAQALSHSADTGDSTQAHAAAPADATAHTDATVVSTGDGDSSSSAHGADQSPFASDAGDGTQTHAAAAPADATAHTDAIVSTSGGDSSSSAHGVDQNPIASPEHTDSASSDAGHAATGQDLQTPVAGDHAADHGAAPELAHQGADHSVIDDHSLVHVDHDQASLVPSHSTAGCLSRPCPASCRGARADAAAG